jgi:hypothetical protein
MEGGRCEASQKAVIHLQAKERCLDRASSLRSGANLPTTLIHFWILALWSNPFLPFSYSTARKLIQVSSSSFYTEATKAWQGQGLAPYPHRAEAAVGSCTPYLAALSTFCTSPRVQ